MQNKIAESEIYKLKNLKVLVINALGRTACDPFQFEGGIGFHKPWFSQ
jgi:hypothetical protein